MSFNSTLTSRFYEMDSAGILFFGRYFEYCHAAYEDLIGVAFGSWQQAFDKNGWLLPVVHAESDYKMPIQVGQKITVTIVVDRIGHSSITFVYSITSRSKPLNEFQPNSSHSANKEIHQVHAKISLTHAFLGPDFKPIRIPKPFLDGLRPFVTGIEGIEGIALKT